jgi:hypothetical protein
VVEGLVEQGSDGEFRIVRLGQTRRGFTAGRGALDLPVMNRACPSWRNTAIRSAVDSSGKHNNCT